MTIFEAGPQARNISLHCWRYLCVSFLAMMLLVNETMAQDWYVEPARRIDTSSGTGTKPQSAWRGFKNIRWGHKGVQPGDTLYLLGGNRYFEPLLITGSGSPNSRIEIKCLNSNGECVIHGRGKERHGIVAENISHVALTGLTIVQHATSGIRILGNSHGVLIRGCRVENNGKFGIYLNAESGLLSDFLVAGNSVKHHHTAGIFVMANTGGSIKRGTITENVVSETRIEAMLIGLRGGTGIQVYPGFGGPFRHAEAREILVSNNQVSNNDGPGIDFSKNVHHSVITQNNVWNNGHKVPASGIHVGGVADEYAHHIIITDNDVKGQKHILTDGAGILVDDFSDRVIVKNNTVSNNEEAGIKLHNNVNTLVVGNNALNNPIGIKSRGSNRFSVLNNRFINNGTAVDIDRTASQGEIINNQYSGGQFLVNASRSSGISVTDTCRIPSDTPKECHSKREQQSKFVNPADFTDK